MLQILLNSPTEILLSLAKNKKMSQGEPEKNGKEHLFICDKEAEKKL